ncbi:hypothetical protein ACHAXR_010955 [Thalassiosira sp. AJA248-18]
MAAPLLTEEELLHDIDADAMDANIPPLNPEDPLFGLRSSQVTALQEIFGMNEIIIPQTPLWKLFLRQFIGFLPLLIELAALISLGVGDYAEFGIIVGMLLANACLGFREEYHAKKSLDELSEQLESEIATRREGETLSLNVKELVPGDVVLLVSGTIVPAETQWISGDTVQVDTAPLTGELLHRKYPGKHGDIILSGTTVVAGECYGRVLRTGSNTEIGKAQADALKNKTVRIVSVFQKKITTAVQVIVSVSLFLVIAVLLVKGFKYDGFDVDLDNTILDVLSILIASIIILNIPRVIRVNLALGAGFLAKHHRAIVTSTPALQNIASMSMLCCGKTGTVTTANTSIIEDQIYAVDGFSNGDVIKYAFLCSNADKKDDPIDQAIVKAFQSSSASSDCYTQTEIIGFNPAAKRVVTFVDQSSGGTLTISKGSPVKIIDTEAGAIDNHELQWKVDKVNDKGFIDQVTAADKELSINGYKTIAISVCEGNARELGDSAVWKFVGLLPMLDPPRHDTPATIESLHHANISVKMITGDNVNVGIETARLIGLGTKFYAGEEMRNAPAKTKNEIIYNADGFASVLPSDKREIAMALKNHFGLVTGMTGDGANDAPALSAAQVGIAVEGATDAAKNSADLILTEPGLSPIYGAVLESRRIFARIKSYVIYRVAASLILVLTLSIVIFVTGCSVDAIYVIILALMNDISMIPVAYDNATATATTEPQLPRSNTLVYQSLYHGLAHSALSLMFFFAMDFDLAVCDGETKGFIWFHLLVVTEMAIFSVRAPGFFLFSMPSPYLMLSVLLTIVAGGLIACNVESIGLHSTNLGYIGIFNLASFLVIDLLKVKFREMIGEEPGDVIASDHLILPTASTEKQKNVNKSLRYVVHNESVLDAKDREHLVEVKERISLGGFFGLGTDLNPNEGFVNKKAGLRRSLNGLDSIALRENQ